MRAALANPPVSTTATKVVIACSLSIRRPCGWLSKPPFWWGDRCADCCATHKTVFAAPVIHSGRGARHSGPLILLFAPVTAPDPLEPDEPLPRNPRAPAPLHP
ncbi:hypothetical protein RA210_U140051 [Rubrivivax sp. A210]|nr:hypothetical protein RA210_U140051 [Rubrivivax sp. A210]